MAVRKLIENVYEVGAIDWERRIFDELIPLPDGTSYNAYLILGTEKTALIDTVDPAKEQQLIDNLQKSGVEKIDYIISQHAEQDHSGTIPKMLELFPNAKVVTNKKCKSFLADLLLIPDEKFKIAEDREKLELGGKTLEFIFTPWVHWPETMTTYLIEDKILFSCDFFGSHYATSELFTDGDARVLENAKRYFAEIMMPFGNPIRKNLENLAKYDISLIAPSHGQVYKKPDFIVDAYKDWVSDDVKNEVLIPFVSMHGSTREMVEYFTDALIERGISVKVFDLPKTDIGELAIALVDAATIIIGTPTVLAGPHPAAVYAAFLANMLRPKTKFASIIGSYGWGGKTVETIQGILTNVKVEILEPVLTKGYPTQEDFAALDKLAQNIFAKHKELNLL